MDFFSELQGLFVPRWGRCSFRSASKWLLTNEEEEGKQGNIVDSGSAALLVWRRQNISSSVAAVKIKIKIQKKPRMADKKPCRVCNFTRQKSYGVVVPSLHDLKTKGEYFYLSGILFRKNRYILLQLSTMLLKSKHSFMCTFLLL